MKSIIAILIGLGCFFTIEVIINERLGEKVILMEKQIQENSRALQSLQTDIEDLKQKVKELLPRTVTITAYTARKQECDSRPDRNAIMEKPKPGTVAVSRDLHGQGWSLGKRVYIDQIGVYKIADLMHPKHENRIDVLVASVKEARRFGAKETTAVLLD